MARTPRTAVVFGEILCDMFAPRPGEALAGCAHLVPRIGGAPANVAVQLARLGTQVELISALGKDPLSERLLKDLAREGVSTRYIERRGDKRAGITLVEVDAQGERTFFPWRDQSPDLSYEKGHLPRAALERAALLHRGTVTLRASRPRGATREAVRIARASGALISLDVNLRPRMFKDVLTLYALARGALRSAHVVKATREEAAAILLREGADDDALVDELLSKGPRLVLLTFGERGALVANRATRVAIPAPRVRCVDATGAGDAFLGAALAQLLRAGVGPKDLDDLDEAELRELGSGACYAGSLATTKLGATTAMPRTLPRGRRSRGTT